MISAAALTGVQEEKGLLRNAIKDTKGLDIHDCEKQGDTPSRIRNQIENDQGDDKRLKPCYSWNIKNQAEEQVQNKYKQGYLLGCNLGFNHIHGPRTRQAVHYVDVTPGTHMSGSLLGSPALTPEDQETEVHVPFM